MTTEKPIRRPRKTPEERGEVGWWAYRTMDALYLTLDQVAARVGVDRGTISKFMGSPKGELGAASRKAMLAYYQEVALANGTPIDEPPAGFIVAGATRSDTVVPAAYLDALAPLLTRLDRQAEMIGHLVEAVRILANSPLTPEEQARLHHIAGVEGEPPPPKQSSPRPLGRLPSGGTPRKGSRATASTEVPQ